MNEPGFTRSIFNGECRVEGRPVGNLASTKGYPGRRKSLGIANDRPEGAGRTASGSPEEPFECRVGRHR